jgi:hypothetical protein
MFFFHNYFIYKVNYKFYSSFSILSYEKDKKNHILGSYLAGLFEGDGFIWIQKTIGTKKHNPRICITFNLKDLPLAEKLLKLIGFGSIRIDAKENACVLTVSPIKGLIIIVNLINGYLRSPKIHQLHSLIDWLNYNHDTNFNKFPINNTSLSSDAWLAGFIDA